MESRDGSGGSRRAGQAGSADGHRQDRRVLCAVECDETRSGHEASRNEKSQDGSSVQKYYYFLGGKAPKADGRIQMVKRTRRLKCARRPNAASGGKDAAGSKGVRSRPRGDL
jgi:hypothetical protein